MSLREGVKPFPTVREAYDGLVAKGEVTPDPRQEIVIASLDRVVAELATSRLAAKSSALGWLFARKRPSKTPVKGVYVHGGVGRGKTMLMDLFFGVAPADRKRRVHFNDFMADVHDRIGHHRAAVKAGTAKGDDPIPPVAERIASESTLLCFDELSVTDIADAMILSRLFSALFASGVTLIATSNVAPADLYKDGLNRPLFTPFIATLERNAEIVRLDSPTDYRMRRLDQLPVYLCPLGPEADRQMDEAWAAATAGVTVASRSIALKGRTIEVPRAGHEAARFTFAELCEAPLGARDYLAIAQDFAAIFIDHIPVLDESLRNPTKRFILLVDTLYDRRMRLVASAAVPPQDLYQGRRGTTEAFEFDRTVSRLIEMQSREWLAAARHPNGEGGATPKAST